MISQGRCCCGNVDDVGPGEVERCFVCGDTVHGRETPAPQPDPPAEITGKVLGYRQWTLEGHELRSAVANDTWKATPNRAVCRAGQSVLAPLGPAPDVAHDVPDPDCMCGLYAYHDPPSLNGNRLGSCERSDAVWGAVLGWGRVETHSNGWRAEWAQPVVLAYHPDQAYAHVTRVQAIAGELGLRCVPLAELQAHAVTHGKPIPNDLRPPTQDREFDIPLAAGLPVATGRLPVATGGLVGASGSAGGFPSAPPIPLPPPPTYSTSPVVNAKQALAMLRRDRDRDLDRRDLERQRQEALHDRHTHVVSIAIACVLLALGLAAALLGARGVLAAFAGGLIGSGIGTVGFSLRPAIRAHRRLRALD